MERDFPFDLKALTEAGEFEGLASVYNVTDEGGDRVLPGAFTETLAKRGAERPVLWAHDMSAHVGLGVLTDTPTGLQVKGSLDLDTQAGQEAYSRLKKRIVRGLSIGFRTLQSTVENGVRLLKSVDLYEVSLVPVPMNPEAQVTAVKSAFAGASIRDFEVWLRDAGQFSKSQARALASGGWKALDGAPDEEEHELLEWLTTANARFRERRY